ncbi:MAG TPA: metallophosphoesterase [Longimicrobium sp.]|nr:metallophosphoesterase [Longimicrobium sp.]
MRIFAVSDLHADFRENRARLDDVSTTEFRHDALIVAGDVADSIDVLTETLGHLKARFAEVFFVPGNHELWVRGSAAAADSVEKFHAVLKACDAAGVRTRPARVGGTWVVPLFGWYHADFDVSREGREEELEAWSDRYFCRWPENVGRPDRYFLTLNEPHVRRYDAPVVTFSHFVPRPELVPPVRYLRFKGLPLVAGTALLDQQLRRIGASVHVFGHTHITEDRVIDGVRYVQNWLRGGGGATHGPFQLVWTAGALPAGHPHQLFC